MLTSDPRSLAIVLECFGQNLPGITRLCDECVQIDDTSPAEIEIHLWVSHLPEDALLETRRLLDAGRLSSCIFSHTSSPGLKLARLLRMTTSAYLVWSDDSLPPHPQEISLLQKQLLENPDLRVGSLESRGRGVAPLMIMRRDLACSLPLATWSARADAITPFIEEHCKQHHIEVERLGKRVSAAPGATSDPLAEHVTSGLREVIGNNYLARKTVNVIHRPGSYSIAVPLAGADSARGVPELSALLQRLKGDGVTLAPADVVVGISGENPDARTSVRGLFDQRFIDTLVEQGRSVSTLAMGISLLDVAGGAYGVIVAPDTLQGLTAKESDEQVLWWEDINRFISGYHPFEIACQFTPAGETDDRYREVLNAQPWFVSLSNVAESFPRVQPSSDFAILRTAFVQRYGTLALVGPEVNHGRLLIDAVGQELGQCIELPAELVQGTQAVDMLLDTQATKYSFPRDTTDESSERDLHSSKPETSLHRLQQEGSPSIKKSRRFAKLPIQSPKKRIYEWDGCTDHSRLNDIGNRLNGQGKFDEAIDAFLEATRLSPATSEIYYNLGNCYRGCKKLEKAREAFERAIEIRPGYSDAYNNLGLTLCDLERREEAVAAYRKGLESAPKSISLWNNLGNVLKELGVYDLAIESLKRALSYDNKIVPTHFNLGTVLALVGREEEALAHLTTAIKLYPDHTDAHLERAAIWLKQGEYELGFPELEWRLKKVRVEGNISPRPRWLGEPITGETILVTHEGTVSEAVLFARYLPFLVARAAQVIVQCEPALRTFFQRFRRVRTVVRESDLPEHDRQVSLASLPALFKTSLDTVPCQIPYLKFAGAAGNDPRDSSRALRIGISTHTSLDDSAPEDGSVLSMFYRITEVAGARFTCLDRNPSTVQRHELERRPHIRMLSKGEAGDIAELAQTMHGLDLVISFDNEVAHLAGALGKPVWVLARENPSWCWMRSGSTTPWYPTAEILRPEDGRWDSRINRVEKDLKRRVQEHLGLSISSYIAARI